MNTASYLMKQEGANMKTVKFHCVYCYSTLETEHEFNGQKCHCPYCKRRLEIPLASLAHGSMIAGWTIGRLLGVGGMGEVYEVTRSNEKAAMKVIRSDKMSESELKYFKEEVAMALTLQHPNIVKALEAGEDGGVCYLVSELIEGRSLEFELKKRQQLKAEEALRIALNVAEAMEYCWGTANLMHRDIKPGNIILSINRLIKITDMGLGIRKDAIAQQKYAAGTANYMSPESLMQPNSVNAQSDIYSLGITLFELISGHVPYEGVTRKEVYKNIINQTTPKLSDRLAGVSPELNQCVYELMAKKKPDRPASWSDVCKLLKATLANLHLGEAPKQNLYVYQFSQDRKLYTKVLTCCVLIVLAIVLIYGLCLGYFLKSLQS